MYDSKECKVCGVIFSRYNPLRKRPLDSLSRWNKRKYCNHSCYYKALGDYELPQRFQKGHKKHGLYNLEKYRSEGGKVWNKGIFGYRLTEGPRKTDLQKLIRTSQKYFNRRKEVFTRDGYMCQECGLRNHKGLGHRVTLHVHHIKPFSHIMAEHNIRTFDEAYNCSELRNISNGQTLCKECHAVTESYKKTI